MFPWWVSWPPRWSTCTSCLLFLFIFLQSVYPTDSHWVAHGPLHMYLKENRSSLIASSHSRRKNTPQHRERGSEQFDYTNSLKRIPKIFSVRQSSFGRQHKLEKQVQYNLENETKVDYLKEGKSFQKGSFQRDKTPLYYKEIQNLSSLGDKTSLEVPFFLAGDSTRGVFVEEEGANSVLRWSLLKKKRNAQTNRLNPTGLDNRKQKKQQGASNKRILKTLVTTPKRIIGSQQGMGGSAVKPQGSSMQHFATEPTAQTAVVGSTAVLPCRVVGKVGHLQWTKDGFGLGTDRDLFGFSRYAMIGADDEGDYSLRIQPVLLDDDALFQCQVSAIDGIPGIRSKPVRLTVYVPPEPPQVSPSILEITSGKAVILQCTSLGGRPPPEIQWVDDSRRETIHRDFEVISELMADGKRSVVESRLTFIPSRHHNNQTITCVTSNQALSSPLSSSISVSVMFPPELHLIFHPTTLIEGDDVTFMCEAHANPALVTYRWFLDGLPIPNKTGRALKIENISRSLHKNKIACEVSNRIGTSKVSKNITVRYGPTFRSMPRDVMSDEGQNATLKCNVDSNPAASIVWLKRGSNKIIGSGPFLSLQVNESLAGVYECVARVRGKDFEFPELLGNLRLLLKGPPTIVSETEQQGRLGDTVSVVCSTVSVPSPLRVTWAYNGKEIDLNDPRYEVVEDEGREKLRHILVIHDSSASDFGAYNCSVFNEYGVAKKLILLQPEEEVPVVFVVGSIVGVLLICVVVMSLLFCNKRHGVVKENVKSIEGDDIAQSLSRPEKTSSTTRETNEAHLYNRPPEEAKLLEEEKPPLRTYPSSVAEFNQLHPNGHCSIEQRKPYQGSDVDPSMRSLIGEIDSNVPCEEVSYKDDYLSCRSQSQTNISFPMEQLNHRTMTQTSLLSASPQKYVGPYTPDYSSLRKSNQPHGILRNHHLSPQNNGHIGNINHNKSSFSNGAPTGYSPPKLSPYNSPSSGAWSPSPLPPPYPRSSFTNGRLLPITERRVGSRHTKSITIGSDSKLAYTPGSKLVSGATYL